MWNPHVLNTSLDRAQNLARVHVHELLDQETLAFQQGTMGIFMLHYSYSSKTKLEETEWNASRAAALQVLAEEATVRMILELDGQVQPLLNVVCRNVPR